MTQPQPIPDAHQWAHLPNWHFDAALQMAIDETMALVCAELSMSLVRFYHFSPPAVTIGRNQRWARVVSDEAMRRLEMGWVRRPTGGGALLHVGELNYAVALPLERTVASADFAARRRIFRGISTCLARGLSSLGVDAEVLAGRVVDGPADEMASLARQQRPGTRQGHAAHGLCSESLTDFELASSAGKLIAAAQWVADLAILQHGTIYLTHPDPALRFWPENVSDQQVALSRRRVGFDAALSDSLTTPPSFDEVAFALWRGFGRPVDREPSGLEAAGHRILHEAKALAGSKYRTDAWNLLK